MMIGMLDTPSTSASSEFDRQRYAAVGRALADPKRLCVLESLAGGELSVSDLSTKVGCQVPNMSQHLAVLRSAGLVQSRRDGSTVLYRLADVRVLEAYRLIQSLAGQPG
jgi:DNA-binding transcriptional ArsR family regulator